MPPVHRRLHINLDTTHSDELIIALAVYLHLFAMRRKKHLWRFRYTQDLLHWLRTHGHRVPAPSTFCERKAKLLGPMVLAVRALAGFLSPPPRLRMDSGKLPTAGLVRAKRVGLSGSIGRDHTNRTYFYGSRLHAQVDEQGFVRQALLRPAHEQDGAVAVWLLRGLRYRVVRGDKGYLSRKLQAEAARCGVDLIAKRKRNVRPSS